MTLPTFEPLLPSSLWLALALCVVLGLAYASVATLLSGAVLRSARRHATLALT